MTLMLAAESSTHFISSQLPINKRKTGLIAQLVMSVARMNKIID